LYDGVNPVQETSGATVLANVLTGLGVDEFFARNDVALGTTSHFLSDGLRSAAALSDPTGLVQTEYTYEPFGKTTATGASSSNPFQYTGRENDGTGLYYYRARYYHPSLQRLISEDPFPGFRTLPQSLNGYPYALNSPQILSDPDGQFPGPVGFVGGGIAGGIGGIVTGGISGGLPGAIAGGISGTISGAITGAILGPWAGGWVGTFTGGIIGGVIDDMLNPEGSVTRDERYFPPVIKNPPVPPTAPDPFGDQKIGNPPDPFKDQQLQCPPAGCNGDMGGRKDNWY
jgi:RHS repeat-associated protein